MKWTPASKEECLAEIERQWVGIRLDVKERLSRYLVEPRPALLERFGETENAFVVGQLGIRVVYFDDVEDTFGIAGESDGKLLDPVSFDNIALALRELERSAGKDR